MCFTFFCGLFLSPLAAHSFFTADPQILDIKGRRRPPRVVRDAANQPRPAQTRHGAGQYEEPLRGKKRKKLENGKPLLISETTFFFTPILHGVGGSVSGVPPRPGRLPRAAPTAPRLQAGLGPLKKAASQPTTHSSLGSSQTRGEGSDAWDGSFIEKDSSTRKK